MAEQKSPNAATLREARAVADRLIDGFNEAVGDSQGALDKDMSLLVGIRGALSAVRSDTKCGWVHKMIGNLIDEKQIALIPVTPTRKKTGAKKTGAKKTGGKKTGGKKR